ncbi:hypothetical protein [Candidatus Uabimicrobium amorphum]|uniref:SnoaL-like domain-containing protein n=1 Tax=Uabimicrobium amorphum TaxID=2596890 RepID=A0A5S9IS99_UABAM|nr:hypothetical protein [Candidatus Uabimicrobium amorphum]BBM86807.1 hypothetical protein UABAM_05195 [Candidatus Uabimicrobium amorphum]
MNNCYKIALLLTFVLSCIAAQNETATKTSVAHAAKTQYFRWYQLYERDINDARIANQLSILDKDIEIETVAGKMTGRDSYPKRVQAYKDWKNAHHVQNVTVKEKEDGMVLDADIIYQCVLPDGSKKNFALHYDAHLKKTDGLLPVFTKIKITPKKEMESAVFEDAYPQNRMKSLMHYWLLCMEQLDGNVTPFKQLLTNEFELNFSTNSKMTSIDQLEKWLNGMPMQLQSSQHFPQNLTIKSLGENKYQVNVEFAWQGVMKNGTKLKATTGHEWIVVDDIQEPFARIQKVTVKQVKPLQQY